MPFLHAVRHLEYDKQQIFRARVLVFSFYIQNKDFAFGTWASLHHRCWTLYISLYFWTSWTPADILFLLFFCRFSSLVFPHSFSLTTRSLHHFSSFIFSSDWKNCITICLSCIMPTVIIFWKTQTGLVKHLQHCVRLIVVF